MNNCRPATLLTLVVAAIWLSTAHGAQNPDERPPINPLISVSDAEFQVPIDEAAAREVDELIGLLGAPKYADRERATARLLEIGIPAFPRLRSTYLSTDDLEVRLRIERIVHTGYFDFHVYERNGFLGISPKANFAWTHDDDPRVPQGFVGVEIVRVEQDTAAERYGLHEGDIIIALDGQPIELAAGRHTEEFSEAIRARGPYARMLITFLRGPDVREIEVVLGRRPPRYYAGQVRSTATDMLEQARTRFERWWPHYFHVKTESRAPSAPNEAPNPPSAEK